MAQAFNLTAQLNLRGPTNIKNIAADIRRQLGTIQGSVNFNIDPRTTRNVSQLESALRVLNNTFSQTQNNAAAAANAIRTFNNAIGNINTATSNVNRTLNNATQATQNLGRQVRTTASQTTAAASEMEEFGRQSALAVRRFAAFSGPTSIILSLTRAITGGLSAFVAYDKEFVKLQQVTDTTAKELKGLSDEITSLAKNFGVASSDLINVASTLAQAGLSARDTERALKALALTDLAPSFDSMNDTVEGSIALMRQFDIQAKDLEKSLGSINAVAAAFAVEASDIITAIQRTGGVFASASKGVAQGTDALNQFVAVFTSVRQTTRESAETIATGLRTIFTRIQRESTIEALKEFGVELTDLEGKFVGPYEAVKKLSEGLSRLDPRDLKFGQIVEELGGFRQIGKVIPLIQQFAVAQEALKVAQAGQGSLAADAVKAQLSLANQMAKVREEFLALMRDIGSSDTFQAIAKSALGFASALIKVADNVKGILPILAVMGIGAAARGASQFGAGFIGGMRRGPDNQAGGSTGGGGGGGGGGRGGFFGLGGSSTQNTQTSTIGVRELILLTDALRTNTSALNNNTNILGSVNSSLSSLIGTINNAIRSRTTNTLNSGGIVQKFARGGVVPGSGNRDTVPAMLQPGEFVIRKQAVETIGADSLYQMNKYGSGGSIRTGSGKRKRFAKGGLIAAKIENTKASDGDTLNVDFTPEGKSFNTLTRLQGWDAFETDDVPGFKIPEWQRKLGRAAAKITEAEYRGKDDKALASFKAAKPIGAIDNYGRPMFKDDSLGQELYSKGLALPYSGRGKAPTKQLSTWGEYRKKFGYSSSQAPGLNEQFMQKENIKQQKMLGGKIQKLARGGQVTRKIGIIDTDVLRDPTNIDKVKKAMEALGITDVSDYSIKLGELAAQARKKEELDKFIAIAGAAGSGKSSLATGLGASDDATLRKTIRSQILTPEDIRGVDQVIALTSTVSDKKLDAYLKEVDKAYVLSSSTKEEQRLVEAGREARDISGAGLYGRKPGTTRGANKDFGVEEVTLREELGKRAVVLGRKAGSYGLRRKKSEELADIVQAKGYYTGGFSPATKGHAGAVDALLSRMIEADPTASIHDILINAAGNLPMKSAEGTEHAARYGIFDSDLRQLMAKINFPGAMLAQGDNPTGGIPKYVEVLGAGAKRKFARTKGAMAVTSGKDPGVLSKYARAGIDVKDIPRIEDISATKVRKALMDGNDKELMSFLNPEIASILMGNRAQLRNRSTMVPMLLESIQSVVKTQEDSINAQISEILASAPGGPYKVLSKKLKDTSPETVKQVEELRKQRDRLSEGALGYRAYSIINELASKYPDMYGVDPNRRSSISAGIMDVPPDVMAEQVRSSVAGAFGATVPQTAPVGLQEAILKQVEKETRVAKSSGVLPAKGAEILKRFGESIIPADPKYGPFSGRTVRDTADGGKLKYWYSKLPPNTPADKAAYYGATRDYLIDQFEKSQGTARTTIAENLTGAIKNSTQLALVGLQPIGYTGLTGPETWNLGTKPNGQDVSLVASIVERALPTQYQSVIDYLSGQTEELVGGAAKLLGITPKKLTKKQRETLGQGNIEGALLEQIFGSADATILDDALRTRPIDFPLGIGTQAAKIFGIDPNIPTEVKRTIDSGSRDKAVEEFQRYFRQQYGIPEPEKMVARMATGGSIHDTVPALLTPGEFVINKKAAQNIGYNKLHKLNKADKIQGYNKGGFVGVQKFGDGEEVKKVDVGLDPASIKEIERLTKQMQDLWSLASRNMGINSPSSSSREVDGMTLYGGARRARYVAKPAQSAEELIQRYKTEGDPVSPKTAEMLKGFSQEQLLKAQTYEHGSFGASYSTSGGMINAYETGRSPGAEAFASSQAGVEQMLERASKQLQEIAVLEQKIADIRKKGITTSQTKETTKAQTANTGPLEQKIEALIISLDTANKVQNIKSETISKYQPAYKAAGAADKSGIKLQAQAEYETKGSEALLASIKLTKEQRDTINTIQSDTIAKYNEEYKLASSAAEKAAVKAKAQIEYASKSRESVFGTATPSVGSSAIGNEKAKVEQICCNNQTGTTNQTQNQANSSAKDNAQTKKLLDSLSESRKLGSGQNTTRSTQEEFNRLIGLSNQLSNTMKNNLAPNFDNIAKAMASGNYDEAADGLEQVRNNMGKLGQQARVTMEDLVFDTSNINSIEDAVTTYDEMAVVIRRLKDTGQDNTEQIQALIQNFEDLGNTLQNAANDANMADQAIQDTRNLGNQATAAGLGLPESPEAAREARIGRMRNRLGMAGMAIGVAGQLGSNLFNDETRGGAMGKAVTQGASTRAGTGLALAGQALSIPGIGPAAAAIVAVGTAAVTVAGAFMDAHNAAREFDKALATKNIQNAMDKVALAFEDFEKDIKNVELLQNVGTQLKTAGANAQAAQDIETNVPKAFWVNMFDALGSTGDEQRKAAERSKILEKEGIGSYFKTLGAGGEGFRERKMASFAPAQALEQSKAFKPVADQTLKLFEAKLRTGTSMEDVMKELKDSSGAPTQFAKNIALANPAIQEHILLIQQNNNISEEEKQKRINSVIAIEAQKKASTDLAATLKNIEFNKLNKSMNMFANSLERTFQQMEQSIGKATFELENMSVASDAFNNALSGSAKASQVNLKSLNVINNPRAYSGAERSTAAEQATSFFGTASKDISSLLQVSGQLEDNILGTINRTIQSNPNASEEGILAKIQSGVSSTVQNAGLSGDLANKLGTAVKKGIAEIRKEGDKGNIGIDELVEKVPALGKTLDSTRRAQELANKALEYWQKNLNEYANAMNQSMEMLLEGNARSRKAYDIQVRGALELQKALGKEVTLRDQVALTLNATAQQTGGVTNPADISANVQQLNQRRIVQQGMSDAAANRGPAGKNEFVDMQQRLRNTNMALRENYDALKNMADNTEIASAALAKIQEVQQKRQAGVNMAERLVTSSPEELSKLNSAMARLSNNMAGIQNVGTTADQRRESLDAFNMIAPMLGPDQGAIKANVLESMLQEAGVGVSPMMQDILNSLRNPEEDPQMREAIDTYKMGNNLQISANQELARLSQLMSDNTAEVAAEKIASSLSKVQLSFESQTLSDMRDGIRRLVELEENKKNEPQAAQNKARGGIIYASAGQMIDFTPKGTDTVPAMLTPGEFVVNRSATQKHLPLLKQINSNTYSKGGNVKYYADGGWVGIDSDTPLTQAGNAATAIGSSVEQQETSNKYISIFDLPNKKIAISTLTNGRIVAATTDMGDLSRYFLNKDRNQGPPSIKAGGIYSVLGPGVDGLEVDHSGVTSLLQRTIGFSLADSIVDNQKFQGSTSQIGTVYPGPRLKNIGYSLVLEDSDIKYKNIPKNKITEYTDMAEKYLKVFDLSYLQEKIKNIKYELPSPPTPSLEYTAQGGVLKNLTAPMGSDFGIFDTNSDIMEMGDKNPEVYGFKTISQITGSKNAVRGWSAVAAGFDNLYSSLDTGTMRNVFGGLFVNPTSGPILNMINNGKTSMDRTIKVLSEIDAAYEEFTTKATKMKESEGSLTNKQYYRDLEELYYGTKLSATIPEEKKYLLSDYVSGTYPVTLFNPIQSLKEKWSDVVKTALDNGGQASSLEFGVPLVNFDKTGKKLGDVKKFPYIDAIAAEQQSIKDILSGAQAAFQAGENANVIDIGSDTIDNGRYMFTYQKLKARFFNDTARRFMGASEALQEFIIIKKQPKESEALNPFVDLTDNQIVYSDNIDNLLSKLDESTPQSGQSGSPGSKPEDVPPYSYNLKLLNKALNNQNALSDTEKNYSFLAAGENNTPFLTDFALSAKSYTLAREKALIANQLSKDQADTNKVFKKEQTKEQKQAEAWTLAKRVTLARKVYETANKDGLQFMSRMPVDIGTVGMVASEIGQRITGLPPNSPQRGFFDAYRAFFAELYHNGETPKSSKEAAQGSDSGSFLKSLGIDISDNAFGPPGPMMKVPGSTTDTMPAYHTSTTNDSTKIKAILARQFIASRNQAFAGSLGDKDKESLAVEGGKIYSINPDGTKTLKEGDKIVPQNYAEVFDMALTPENLFPNMELRQQYLDQLIKYYSTAADASGQPLFPGGIAKPFIDSLGILKAWYAVQDAVLNTGRTPEQLLAIRGGLQALGSGTIPPELDKQFTEITGKTVEEVKNQAIATRDVAQQASSFLTADKYGQLPDLDRMIALLNVQAMGKANEMQQEARQELSRGGVVYASTGKLINFQPRGTDTVPAMLTPGEFVVNRGATQQHLPVLQAINSGNYSRGDIVKHLNRGGMVTPGYYQMGGPASAGLAGFDFGSFMQTLISQISSGITEAAKQAFGEIAKNNASSSSGVSNNSVKSNFDGISEFTSKLERIATTLASLSVPSTINITGKHDVNVIINGDEALSKLSPDIQQMVTQAMSKAFGSLIEKNQPVPSDKLIPPDIGSKPNQ